MTDAPPSARRLTGPAKLAVDLGPLAVFLVGYFFGRKLAPLAGAAFGQSWTVAHGHEMYLAIALFLPAFAIAFGYSVWRERRVAPMLLVTGVVLLLFGGLTLLLHDKTFFYMKPTITYALFAAVLGGGMLAGRNLLRLVFDGAFHMPEAAWRTLTIRFVGCFAVLAIANEVLWRWLMRDCDLSVADAICAGEPTWVKAKVFGFTAVYFLFIASQAPFIAKNIISDANPDEA